MEYSEAMDDNSELLQPLANTPSAVLFDAYGTLFDVYSVSLAAEQLFAGQGQQLAALWRDKQIEYTRLLGSSRRGAQREPVYQPFWEVTRAALRYSAKRLQLDLLPEHESRLMNEYRHLSAFPEVHEVLQTLKQRGMATGILTNGDPDMVGVAVKSAGLTGLLDHVLSVDAVKTYKTHPEAYALGEQATGQPARDMLFVSCNGWDALGATWYGFQTLWVNRYGLPFEELGPRPTRTGRTLRDVLPLLG